MSKTLLGKVALVTGAARIIGRAIALRLVRDGAAVIINYAGSVQQAQETVGTDVLRVEPSAYYCP